jgi:fatty acid desaturase
MSNLQKILLVVGVVMLMIAAGTAVTLYQSFGVSPSEKAFYAGMGTCFAVLGAVFPSVIGALWESARPVWAAGVFLVWVSVLFPIGIQSHLGFMSLAQAELAKADIPAQLAQAEMDEAQNRVVQTAPGGNRAFPFIKDVKK